MNGVMGRGKNKYQKGEKQKNTGRCAHVGSRAGRRGQAGGSRSLLKGCSGKSWFRLKHSKSVAVSSGQPHPAHCSSPVVAALHLGISCVLNVLWVPLLSLGEGFPMLGFTPTAGPALLTADNALDHSFKPLGLMQSNEIQTHRVWLHCPAS